LIGLGKMGLFDSIKKIGSKVLDYVSAPLSQPVTTFTQGWTAGAQAVESTRKQITAGDTKLAGKVVLTTLGTTAIAAGATLAAGGAAGAGAAGAAARQVATSSIVKKGALFAGVAAVTAPNLTKKALQEPAITKTVVASAVNPALGIATALEQGTSLVQEAVKENAPALKKAGLVAGGVAATAAAGAAGLGIAKILKDNKPEISVSDAATGKILATNKPAETETIPKTTPGQVTTAPAATSKPMNIVQKVAVNVNQRQSKKYLNRNIVVKV